MNSQSVRRESSGAAHVAAPPAGEPTLPEQMAVRKAKRDRILARGEEAYPVSVGVTHTLPQVREKWGHLQTGDETNDVVGVCGRVVHVRNTGKLCFAAIQDGEGTRLQLMISLAEVGEDSLAAFKADVDLGDFLFVQGRVISSKRGELSVMANAWQLAAKAIRPLPVLHKELSEESRVRQRYVDLIARDAARAMVRTRAAVVHSLRATLASESFIEIETPMLQVMHGGAAARPFVTHINAFDMDLYLRIAPELFLKRAVVGGIERVFEINRNFRNEGVDSAHSPEFAMLEAYEAYGDYNTMAARTKKLVQQAALDAFGTLQVTLADGSEYDLGDGEGLWTSISLYESLSDAVGREITPATSVADLHNLLAAHGVAFDPARVGHGKAVEQLWEHLVGDHLWAPTFVRDFPVETSPLTRAHRTKAGVTEKWDLIVRGMELATAYSELVDPVIQRERLVEQARAAAGGDDEAMPLDEDFLTAMEYGMPPSGGMGMGIDRLLIALTGTGIRETILFPLVKPTS